MDMGVVAVDCEQMSRMATQKSPHDGLSARRTKSTLEKHAMEIPGLAPFLATLLFGKCPMFDISRVLRAPVNRRYDEGDSDSTTDCDQVQLNVGGKVCESSSCDVRTASLTADDSSSTLSTCGDKPSAPAGNLAASHMDSDIASTPVANENENVEEKAPCLPDEQTPAPVKTVVVGEAGEGTKQINPEMLEANTEGVTLEQPARSRQKEEQPEDAEICQRQPSPPELQENAGGEKEERQGPDSTEAPLEAPPKDSKEKEEQETTSKDDKGKVRFTAQVIFPSDFRLGASLRQNSFNSKNSKISHNATSVTKSVVSRCASIISASKSVQSLPREAELQKIGEDMSSKSPKTKPKRKLKRKTTIDSTDIRQVTSAALTDPYGEEGSFTGSLSKSSGMPHGFGRFVFTSTSARWFEGEFKHGEWIGKGRLSHENGDFYKGRFHYGRYHGEGIMKYADGRVFQGSYMHGQMVQGQMSYPDGSTYCGGWVDGMRHGRGQSVFSDHSVYVGEFRTGEFSGYGKMLWMDGGYYEGEWEEGEQTGFGKEILPNGNLKHEGQWKKGQPVRNGMMGLQ